MTHHNKLVYDGPERRAQSMWKPNWRWAAAIGWLLICLTIWQTVSSSLRDKEELRKLERNAYNESIANGKKLDSLREQSKAQSQAQLARINQLEKALRDAGLPVPSPAPGPAGPQGQPGPPGPTGSFGPSNGARPTPSKSSSPKPSRPPSPTPSPSRSCRIISDPICV